MTARHPNKHLRAAIEYSESRGWRFEPSPGHAYGHLLCPQRAREGCMVPVWSTSRNPENHAKQIRRAIDACPHGAAGGADA